jgi:hypothetical protein
VLYQAKGSPTAPGFFPIGISTDASSHFGLPYLPTGIEPIIQAIPFDPLGNPLVISGLGGQNVAVGYAINLGIEVPEPATIILGMLGLAGVVAIRRRTCKYFPDRA